MRVWHDNSGKGPFSSWYLNFISVKDLQTDERQIFIANRWFALEEDDGQIDRIIPLAGKEQLEDFNYQFSERSKKDFVDGHLWFSVVARPPGSRFTCVQRVACCLCLLFMTMLTNAMFYNTPGSTSTSSTTSFSFGPFSLSSSQLFIGFVSTLIVFPVNFLLVYMFRKSKPRFKRPSPVTLAFRGLSVPKTDGFGKTQAKKRTTKSRGNLSRDNAVSATPSETCSTTQVNLTPKKKKGFQLPWWCVIVAWMLLIICTLGSAALVTFYGITFQDEQAKEWITSLIFSFFTSVFITQPLKVILTALLLSLICKDTGDDDDDNEAEDMEQDSPSLDYLHATMDSTSAVVKPKTVAYSPPTPEQLEQIRTQRLKEVKMWAVIREILFYCIFIVVLLALSHKNRGPDNFWYKDTMYRTFITSSDTSVNFEKILSPKDFWSWAKTGLLNGLIAGQYYNAYPPLRLRTYINDKTSRMLGYATLRQLRVYPGQCQVPSYFHDILSECNELFTKDGEERRSFGESWEQLENFELTNRTEYTWTAADSLNSYPYWGQLGVYSGGGYVAKLIGSKDEVFDLLAKLEREEWIDRYTRAVFVEFSVYNPQVNLFSVNMLLAEFHITNGIVPSFRFEPAMLLPYTGSAMVIQVILEIIFVLFIVGFIFREAFNFYRQRRSYLTDFWNWIEMSIIAFSIAAIVGYFYKLYEVNKLTKEIKASEGYGYVKLQFVGYWNEIFSYMLGFVVFLATLKFLRLLRFNRRVSMLANTLELSGKNLLHFSIIFLIVFLAFCQLFWLTFMTVDETYSSFMQAMVASILMMMGKFNIYTMIQAKPIVTQIFVLLYLISMTFIIVNMFVSILNDTFSIVRNNVKTQSNDYEILQFMMSRFMSWTGIQGSQKGNTLDARPLKGVERFLEDENRRKEEHSTSAKSMWVDPVDPHLSVFPSRVDRLLQSLSTIYRFDQENATKGLWNKVPYQAPRRESVLKNTLNQRNGRPSDLARIDN
ncbi:polycystic kidney disease protein 1-like 2 [Plakobranchus ocellatus]|uniref:Polycystic kidney disease protein 1-like 2 n=1 Tax=Plakobranchus ocellatus TaxID=259542 RepID=A0AAV3ZIM5_9GAST|nr:polycystic kidney disease protein 1-like 2 [Plakobranchus ocellatus]